MRNFSFTLLLLVLFPVHAFAYQVPERDYWRAFMLSLINESRKEEGLSPIGIDPSLNALSQAHANDSATHFDEKTEASRRATYIVHVSSDGRTLGDRVKDEGITGAKGFGENVGLRLSSKFIDVHAAVEEAITLMHSAMMAEVPPDDGHRVTILSPDYTHVGIGLELHKEAGKNPNTLFFVTDFAVFTDGREVVIPAVGKRPEWVLPEAPSKVAEKAERSRRVRVRTIDRVKRKITTPAVTREKPVKKEAKTLQQRSAERRLQRLEKIRP